MEILESAPKLSDKKINCKNCGSFLSVNNDDVIGIRYCTSFVPETLSIREHLFGPDEHLLKVPKGYVYTVHCPICKKNIEVQDHMTYSIEKHEYSY